MAEHEATCTTRIPVHAPRNRRLPTEPPSGRLCGCQGRPGTYQVVPVVASSFGKGANAPRVPYYSTWHAGKDRQQSTTTEWCHGNRFRSLHNMRHDPSLRVGLARWHRLATQPLVFEFV